MTLRIECSSIYSIYDRLWFLRVWKQKRDRRAALRILFEVKYRKDNYLLCCLQEYAQHPGSNLTPDTARWAVSQL